MFVYLSKILPLMVLPTGLAIELMLLALVSLWRGWRRMAMISIALAVSVLAVFSMPRVADSLLAGLERRHPPVPLAEVPAERCIAVLGGAVEPALAPRVDLDLDASADRLRTAALLHRAGKGEFLLVSGGNWAWPWLDESEAQAMAMALQEWGVPPPAVVPETRARNTRENAVFIGEIAGRLQCGRLLLVTSAAHMPRAAAVFTRAGLEHLPVPVDVRVYDRPDLRLVDFLPNAGALDRSSDALREYLGLFIYRLRGWA